MRAAVYAHAPVLCIMSYLQIHQTSTAGQTSGKMDGPRDRHATAPRTPDRKINSYIVMRDPVKLPNIAERRKKRTERKRIYNKKTFDALRLLFSLLISL